MPYMEDCAYIRRYIGVGVSTLYQGVLDQVGMKSQGGRDRVGSVPYKEQICVMCNVQS